MALVGVSFLGLYLLRRPLASFRLRHKDSELEIRPSQPQIPQLVEAQASPPEVREPEHPSPTPSNVVTGAELQSESRFDRAFKLLDSGEYGEGIKLMEEEARSEPDLEKQVSLIAYGQQLAAARGSQAALDDLRRNAREHQGVFDAQFWLAIALENLGVGEEARAAYLQAYKSATSDGDRATALISRTQGGSLTQPEAIRAGAELLLLKSPKGRPGVVAHLHLRGQIATPF